MSSFVALASRGQGASQFRQDARFAQEGEGGTPPPLPDEDPLSLAWAEGFAQGQAAVHAEMAGTLSADQAAQGKLASGLQRLGGELTEDLRRRLVTTVTELCAATLEPYALDVDVLIRRVERAVAMLARADDERVIRLNPEDRKLIADAFAADWTVTDDPALPRGSLRVETANGGVEDGPDQWRRALAEAFAGC